MGIQLQLENGSLIGGGGAAFKAANVHPKPLDHGVLGHYRTAVTVLLLPAQAANSRLFELRNAGSNLIIPTRVEVTVLPVGGIANPYTLDLTMFKCTNFTAVDGSNTVSVVGAAMRTSGMSAAPGGAQARYLTSGGAETGMTGGTMTKQAAIGTLLAWMASASASSMPVTKQMAARTEDEHPMVYAQNEGFEIENVVLGSATANAIKIVIEVAWAEVTAY